MHLELIETMSAEGFLLSVRRFIARRGKPKLIISDNASQIKLGNEVIENIWKNATGNTNVQSYISNECIKWKYTVAYAPWQGGFYERLVGLTKRSLRKALGRIRATKEHLLTLIQEIEAVINSRPLMYVDDDINSQEALTPSHFTSINTRNGVPDIEIDYYPIKDLSTVLLEAWKRGQIHLNRFWMTWSNEYLQNLREKHCLNMKPMKGEITRMPRVGEVVIVKEEGMPRGSWKLARISNLIESEIDGLSRAANLQTMNGNFIKRPLRLLYPLEGSNNEEDKMEDELQNGSIKIPTNPKGSNRPKRIAASIAGERIRKLNSN